MGYGHAERNLALIRQLEAETMELLETLNQHDPEQAAWLQEVASQTGMRFTSQTGMRFSSQTGMRFSSADPRQRRPFRSFMKSGGRAA